MRLTSSNFGKIARRHDSTPVANQVKTLLYSKPVDTKALRWGKSHEPDACDSYITYLNSKGFHAISVKSSGLVISASDPYLAASPDGVVSYTDAQNTRHGIVEYKCPYSLAEKSPTDGVPYCTPGLELKKTHCYYYQIQGCMALTATTWCDFVIWTPHSTHVERINFDIEHWNAVKPKLRDFYFKAVLPELASPRYTTRQSIREPS